MSIIYERKPLLDIVLFGKHWRGTLSHLTSYLHSDVRTAQSDKKLIKSQQCTKVEFLDVIGTKVSRVFLLSIHTRSHLYKRILLHPPPPPLSKSGLKLVCNVNIVLRKPQVWELSILCPETSTKLYVHEFGFGTGSKQI
jgi:hypothetical protein